MQITQTLKAWGRYAYGTYAWLVMIAVIVPVTILLVLVPGIMRRRKLAQIGARLVSVLTFSPIRVTGWRIPDAMPCIVVSNHASYLDGIILTAVLPPRFAFLIKREMASAPLAGRVLKLLASEFVDREDAGDRHRVAKRLVATATRGWTLAVFPEGTFDIAPGLKPFHSGAFIAAMRGNLPIVPVVIRGSRTKMPGEQRLPRPGRIEVHICDAIPSSKFASTGQLIAATRSAMLEYLNEPDLTCEPTYERS